MKCIYCDSKTTVRRGRARTDKAYAYERERVCSICKKTFTTTERVDWSVEFKHRPKKPKPIKLPLPMTKEEEHVGYDYTMSQING